MNINMKHLIVILACFAGWGAWASVLCVIVGAALTWFAGPWGIAVALFAGIGVGLPTTLVLYRFIDAVVAWAAREESTAAN